MIRLNIVDNKPADLMFAWGGRQVTAKGINPYDEEFEKLNNVLVYENDKERSQDVLIRKGSQCNLQYDD